MATFTTKYSVGDKVYYINEDCLTLIASTVASILVRQDLSRGTTGQPKVQYILRGDSLAIDEALLYSQTEAQTQMAILIAKKQAEIGSL